MNVAYQQCIDPDCNATYSIEEVHVSCPRCAVNKKQSLLDIRYDWSRTVLPKSCGFF
jgi:threonine synthase